VKTTEREFMLRVRQRLQQCHFAVDKWLLMPDIQCTGMHIQPMSTNRSQTYGTQQITCRYAHIQYVQKN